MKTNLARIICFNAVLLLLSGIFFTSANTFLKKDFRNKGVHFEKKSETSMDFLSFMEEEDDEENWNDLIPILDNKNTYSFSQINYHNEYLKFKVKHKFHLTSKVPRWIKIRHIII